MATLGRLNNLPIVELCGLGAYLDAGELGEVLLPGRYLKGDEREGDRVEVFIYCDSEDRLVATTERPKIMLDEFAWLKVVDNGPMGAFLDWGLPKDLLLHFREQVQPLPVGRWVLVRLIQDQQGRLAATAKVEQFLKDRVAPRSRRFRNGQSVELLICGRTDLGVKAIIDNSHWGLLYHSELFQTLRRGQRLPGFIRKVRDDGHLELALQRTGHAKVSSAGDKLLAALDAAGGQLNLHDKSSPEEIYQALGVSKKAFKQAVGQLLKHGDLELIDGGIKRKLKPKRCRRL